ncbi:MAG: AAA family ATPase [Fluviicola sp.]
MIKTVTIRNFKAFKNASINMAPLTLFTGMNGMGKSTFIQSLLLLRQSQQNNTLFNSGLSLSGEYLELGKGKDVHSINADGDFISFDIVWDNNFINAKFDFKKETQNQDSRTRSIAETDILPINIIHNSERSSLLSESLFTSHFQYLNADRHSPKAFFPASVHKVEQLRSVGNRGEYTAHFLATFQRDPVSIKELHHEKAESDVLVSQVSAWLSEITPGVDLISTLYNDLDIAKLSYRFEMKDDYTAEFRPVNVGFGFTYALPVITAILAAKIGDLIIIENPESHLHPKGQVILGKLFAKAAAAGIQIIIESHSDHLLNSLCVSVKKQLIKPEDIAIYYFERKENAEEHITEIIRPVMQSNGRLDKNPQGFFDEYDNQLDELLS